MKKFSCLVVVFISYLAIGQNDSQRKIYLDSLFNESNEMNHVYYRIVNDYYKKQLTYKMVDFYKSGAIYKEGYSKSNSVRNSIGEEVSYYETGTKKESVRYTDEGKTGPYSSWYEDGSNQTLGFYILNGKANRKSSTLKIDQFWSSDKLQTVTNGNGYYDLENAAGDNKGNIINGYKDGIWSGSDTKYKYKYTEKYANGELTAGVSIDRDSIKHIYHEVEVKPEFMGGTNEFYKYVAKNFQIPETKGLNGKLFISFVVEKDGNLDNIKIIRSMGKAVDDEGYRIISECPAWKPGEIRGIKIPVVYSLPINIQSP
jgi:hypothetical protein